MQKSGHQIIDDTVGDATDVALPISMDSRRKDSQFSPCRHASSTRSVGWKVKIAKADASTAS